MLVNFIVLIHKLDTGFNDLVQFMDFKAVLPCGNCHNGFQLHSCFLIAMLIANGKLCVCYIKVQLWKRPGVRSPVFCCSCK